MAPDTWTSQLQFCVTLDIQQEPPPLKITFHPFCCWLCVYTYICLYSIMLIYVILVGDTWDSLCALLSCTIYHTVWCLVWHKRRVKVSLWFAKKGKVDSLIAITHSSNLWATGKEMCRGVMVSLARCPPLALKASHGIQHGGVPAWWFLIQLNVATYWRKKTSPVCVTEMSALLFWCMKESNRI